MKLPARRLLILLVCFLAGPALLLAQDGGTAAREREALDVYINNSYGPDQALYRGYLNYNAYFQCEGHPYFPDASFHRGTLSRRGTLYRDVSLKYDCYAQVLVLEYSSAEGLYNQLILEAQGIDSFSLGALQFRKIAPEGRPAAFYQYIREGSLACMVHWRSEKVPLNDFNKRYLYRFSRPTGTVYITYAGQDHAVSGKKDYLSIFPAALKPEIRKFFRDQRFSFTKAGPGDLRALLALTASALESRESP